MSTRNVFSSPSALSRRSKLRFGTNESLSDSLPKEQLARWKALSKADAKAEFEASAQRIVDQILTCDPVLLLSLASLYQFRAPHTNSEQSESDPVLQFHLEWLQGLCLRHSRDEYAPQQSAAGLIDKLNRDLKQIVTLSVLERWQRLRLDPKPLSPLVEFQERARGERLAVRNWGYSDQMFSITQSIGATISSDDIVVPDLQLGDLPVLFKRIVEETEKRANRLRRKFQALIQHSKSPLGACKRWANSDLPGADQAADLAMQLESGIATKQTLVARLFEFQMLAAPSHFTFSANDIIMLSPQPMKSSSAESLLKSLSLIFGSLNETPINHLTLGNPVWSKPFIDLGEGQFFCPIPGILISYCLDLCESLIKEDRLDEWWDARSNYLENRVSELASASLDATESYTNTKWNDPKDHSTIYENDLALVTDDILVVIECKSHRVPSKARRGAPNSISDSILELVVKPSNQSQRFVDYLILEQGTRPFFNEKGEFAIDISDIQSIARMNCVLDSFIVASTSNRSLEPSGILKDTDSTPAPTLLLSDLESILRVLPDSLQRLHYISRRSIVQSKVDFVADEMDLLALYLEDGFGILELDNTSPILIHGLCVELDPILEMHYAGLRHAEFPKRRLTPLWQKTLQNLQKDREKHWTSVGLILLDATFQQQLDFAKAATQHMNAVVASRASDFLSSWRQTCGNSLHNSLLIGIAVKGDEDIDDAIASSAIDYGLGTEDQAVVLMFHPEKDRSRPSSLRFLGVQR